MNEPSHSDGAPPPVRRLGREHIRDVVDVLCEAFADYPVMRFVLGERDESYDRRCHALVRFFAMARVLRDEPMLGIFSDSELGAVALVSFPDRSESPAELGEIRADVWQDLGSEARARYEAFGEATAPFDMDVPHIHLNMIGVRPSLQGTGLGRRLLEEVHRMSREDARSEGVSLTTEIRSNVALYEYFGYELVGHARVAPELETWGLFRRDDSGRPHE